MSEDLSKKLEKFAELLESLDSLEEWKETLTHDELQKFIDLKISIYEDFVIAPGRVIQIEETERAEEIRTIINSFWDSFADEKGIFDIMLAGGFGGIIAIYMADYVSRLKHVKPMIVSIDPDDYNFGNFYEEAVQAWLFGAPKAALALCGAILEEVLFSELLKANPMDAMTYSFDRSSNVVGIQSMTLKKLIDLSIGAKIIEPDSAKLAHNLRRLRNRVLHDLEDVSQEDSLLAIENTRVIIENVLLSDGGW